ncbi:MAG: sigma-70 family RNA polymerase sigma factor [Planctomycetota bacterium]
MTSSEASASRPKPPPEDVRLVERLREGDELAFEELVRSFTPRLLATARRFLRNEEDARDAVQEAFLSAFKNLGRFEGHSRISTWLHRILINAALMKLRSRKRRPEISIETLLPKFLDDGHNVDPPGKWSESAGALAQQREIQKVVRDRIEELPENYRTVLLLRDIAGHDTAEAAEILDVTPNAVKIRLHRARQALKTLLDPNFLESSR